MFKISSIKKVFVHIRNSLKLIFLLILSIVIITGIITLVYRPMYSVELNGEHIGYTRNKSKLQKRINEYVESENENNIAFIDIASLPEYSLCLLKRDNETNDDEIFDTVKNSGTAYYQYYAILDNNEEKFYVSSKEEAEEILDTLKKRSSTNINELAYTQVHSTELKEFTEKDTIVDDLYVKPVVMAASYSTYYGDKIITAETPVSEIEGIGLIRPVSGVITSRYGARWGSTHKGLDIANNVGTPIAAAAAGTVVFSGWDSYGLGNCVKISHGNGIETVYGHCSTLYVTTGQYVAQGEVIAAMGSTGNSTGPHLHLEIRVNGMSQNPQLYLYN